MKYIFSLKSELLKTKRSSAFWLSLIGGFFVPLIFLLAYLKEQESFSFIYPHDPFAWNKHFMKMWQAVMSLLLPLGITLAISLIAQLEYKNNTWKQLHTTPQNFGTIFLAKFSVILILMFQFFIFFNLGILLAGVIPSLLFDRHLPEQSIPYLFFLKGNIKFFIVSLPIIALQYMVSLKYKNFMISIGIGILGLIGTLVCMSWKYIFVSPFSYCIMSLKPAKSEDLYTNIYLLSFFYFLLLMIINYFLYINKKEKG
jgi:hypothetical protein